MPLLILGVLIAAVVWGKRPATMAGAPTDVAKVGTMPKRGGGAKHPGEKDLENAKGYLDTAKGFWEFGGEVVSTFRGTSQSEKG